MTQEYRSLREDEVLTKVADSFQRTGYKKADIVITKYTIHIVFSEAKDK